MLIGKNDAIRDRETP